jgi:hypothetical protein
MLRMLYPSEANNLHMLGSNDIYNGAFRMWFVSWQMQFWLDMFLRGAFVELWK